MIDNSGVVERSESRRAFAVLTAYLELTKPRLTLLAVLTTLAGYWIGAEGSVETLSLIQTLVGTALVGASCGILNMVIERDLDAMMSRTAGRPLPAGRVRPREAGIIGVLTLVAGLAHLLYWTNFPATVVAAITAASYLLLYTPLKRRTSLNTLVGAIPGALPPVIGWAAATGGISIGAAALFAVLFFWQMPHFLALAWMYRQDYARAGYQMLPVVDEGGEATARQIGLYVAALVPVSLLPTLVGVAGALYFFGAIVLGLVFMWLSLRLILSLRNQDARWLFHYSLVYLPILLLLMALA